jgi:sulfonate transport system substrate-binding protein
LSIRRTLLFVLVASLAVLGPLASGCAKPVTIRIGWVIAPGELTPILFAHPGLDQHQGQSYVLEPLHFGGGPLALTALASGDIDVGGFGYATIGNAIVNAGMTDLRVLGDVAQDGVPGWSSNAYFVLKDSPIHGVEDLRGKTLAVPLIGSLLDVSQRAMLRAHGIDDKKDVSIIEVGFPNMRTTLEQGKVDMIGLALPWLMDPALRQSERVLFTQREAIGRVQVSTMVARAGFIAANRAAMVDFLEDNARAVRWYMDPANHDAAVKIVADFFKRPPETFAWLFTREDQYRDPNMLPDIDALQANIDLLRKFGLLKADLDIRPHVDLSLVREAVARLGVR